MPNTPSKKATAGLIVLILLAQVVRLAAVFLQDMPPLNYSENGGIALRMFQGLGHTYPLYGLRPETPLQSFVPPLYTGLVYLVLRAFDNPSLALGIIQAALGAAAVPVFYALALHLSRSPQVAMVTAAAAAFYPPLVISAARPHTLVLNVFLLTFTLMAASITLQRKSVAWSLVTGLVLGVSLHSRPMWILIVPILFVWLWLNMPGERRTAIKLAAVTGGVALLLLIPWTLRSYRVHNQFIFVATNGGLNLWQGNNPFTTGSGHEVEVTRAYAFLGQTPPADAPEIREMHRYPMPRAVRDRVETIDEVELDRQLRRAALEYVRENPGEWRRLMGKKLTGFLWFRANIGGRYQESWTGYYKLLYAALLVPLAFGLLFSLRQWRIYALIYLLFAAYVFLYTLFSVQTRYRWEIEGLFLMFAALAAAQLLAWIQGRRGQPRSETSAAGKTTSG